MGSPLAPVPVDTPGHQRLITDFGHTNRDEPDVIMTKIRDMRGDACPGSAGPG
jgi:hypothetical protein